MGWMMTAYGPMRTEDGVGSVGLAALAAKLIGEVGEQKITAEQAIEQAKKLLVAEEEFARERDSRMKKMQKELEDAENRLRTLRAVLNDTYAFDVMLGKMRTAIEESAQTRASSKAQAKKAIDLVFGTYSLGHTLHKALHEELDKHTKAQRAAPKPASGAV